MVRSRARRRAPLEDPEDRIVTAVLTDEHRARIGLTDEEWSALEPSTRDVVRTACFRKVDFRYRPEDIARHKRTDGAAEYRCPFCGGKHLSTHPPTTETLAGIARAIRDVHGNAPGR